MIDKYQPKYYILGDNFEVSETNDVLAYAEWFATYDRHVAKTKVEDVEVSTVFLGLDHNFMGDVPILWETMIFGDKEKESLYDYQERYATFDEAKAGHQRAVEFVREKLNIDDQM